MLKLSCIRPSKTDPISAKMDMGSMSMGDGIPTPSEVQKMYWAVVGAAIATGTVINIYHKFLCRQRFARYNLSGRNELIQVQD